MREVLAEPELVAYCGLYCGACKAYLKEKCAGCHDKADATWCKVRACCIGKNVSTCASCDEFKDPRRCKKFNNAVSKLFGMLFGSDRPACIDCIQETGLEAFAHRMAEARLHSIKR
jgi:hypothetical protein